MAEANPGVANLLNALGGDAVSPEIAGFVNNDVPPFSPIPPPQDEPPRTYRGRPVLDAPADKQMNKTEAKEFVRDARANTDPVAGMKKFGELARLVGNGVRVRIRKRLPSGHWSHIDDYAQRDVEFSGDVEAFIQKHLKPVRGGGTYQCVLVDQKGQEYFVGDYHIDGLDVQPGSPAVQTQSTDMMAGIVRDLLNRPQPLPPDPIEQLKKAQSLMDSFAPKTPPSNNDGMFALMMESQRQASAQMIALLTSKPQGPDPMLLMLLEEMKEMRKASAAPPPPPPPPPMMPAAPAYTMPELLTAITGAVGVLLPLIKGDPGIKPMELVAMMQNAQTQTQTMMATIMGDRLTAKDMMAMQREQSSGTPTLVDQMQQLAAVKEFASQLSPAPAGPQGTTFWDAVVTLVGNPMVAEGLGSRIAKGGEATPPPRPVTIEDRGRKADPQIAAPQEAAAPDPTPLPANFSELCKAIDAAQDDSSRAEAVFAAIKSLQPFPQWRGFCEGLLVALAKNDQARAVGGLGQWFAALVHNEHISSAGADRAVGTFDRNFAIIRRYALDNYPLLRPFAPDYGQPPPAAPAAAPVAEGAPEENGVEEATGPEPVTIGLEHELEGHQVTY